MTGLCHICVLDGYRLPVPIEFCGDCGHYFCEGCRKRWFARTLEAIKEMFLGSAAPGCCGPEEVTDAGGQREAA
jgi:hypothetical protein